MAMRVVRMEAPPLKLRDGFLRMPTAKGAVFAELLPTVAVRRVAGNSTLYSVVYRRPKKTATKKTSEKAEADVIRPLIVTVYQSDLRAKKFNVLLKMKVDVRLPADESYRFGVAVAVDEVAACVYVAYTRDEPTRSPAHRRRLLLRRVRLTLAAADACGVRRLQRPTTGVQRGHSGTPSLPQSVIFEAKTYTPGPAAWNMGATKKAETRVSVQQLLLDGAALLLQMHVGFGAYHRGAFVTEYSMAGWAQLKLRKKSASMNVVVRPPICRCDSTYVAPGAGQHKFHLRNIHITPQKLREMPDLLPAPYWRTPPLFKLGAATDAACPVLADAYTMNGGNLTARQQLLAGQGQPYKWITLGSSGCRQIFICAFNGGEAVLSVRGLDKASQPKIVSSRSADLTYAPDEWQSRAARGINIVRVIADGSWLLGLAVLPSKRQPSSTKLVILRASLRSLLPPKTVCANCHLAIRPTSPDKKKVCKVCVELGFTEFSWVFGCHFCSAACLRDAWRFHARLHRMPPLKDWTDKDWKQWRRDNSKQLSCAVG